MLHLDASDKTQLVQIILLVPRTFRSARPRAHDDALERNGGLLPAVPNHLGPEQVAAGVRTGFDPPKRRLKVCRQLEGEEHQRSRDHSANIRGLLCPRSVREAFDSKQRLEPLDA